MKDLIKQMLREGLDEGKQAGVLYHFTTYDGLRKILLSNGILTSTSIPYVSFTRNKSMKSDTVAREVRITVDGNGLSNKYKLTPYADVAAGYSRMTSDESEERVSLKQYPKGIDISRYIINIELKDVRGFIPTDADFEDDTPAFLPHYYQVIDIMKRKHMQINIVKEF